MNVRITPMIEGSLTVLRVDGLLRSADLPELDKEVRAVDRALALDLSELQSADEPGIDRLRELATSGAELRGVSHYLQMLLKDPGS